MTAPATPTPAPRTDSYFCNQCGAVFTWDDPSDSIWSLFCSAVCAFAYARAHFPTRRPVQ